MFFTVYISQPYSIFRYTFDSRVRDINPNFTLESGYRSEHATLRDLVAHRTGLVDTNLPLLVGAYSSRDDYLRYASSHIIT